MALLAENTKVGNGSVSTTWMTQLNIYTFNTTDGSTSLIYLHFKTNVLASVEKIIGIEVVGYNYGTTQAIRGMQCFYTTGGGSVTSKGSNYSADGLYPDGVYKSSDGYACVRFVRSAGHYFSGFILNAYTSYSFGTSVSILAANQNSTSGNYY